MGKWIAIVMVAVVFGAFCGIAQADFVTGTFWCDFPDDPNQEVHDWTFDDATNSLTLAENIAAIGPDQVTMSGSTDADPVFHVTKTVTNSSTETWTGYILTLGSYFAGDAGFVGSPDTDVFSLVSVSPTEVVFGGATLAPGETVVMDFDIDVTSIGGFGFTMTQNPVPEPATVALLGLGGLLFGAAMRRRRR
jgi:hypothetical protein